MTPIPVFYIEATQSSELFLRRYSEESSERCPLSFHNAKVSIGRGPAKTVSGDLHPHDDERWPIQCECGYLFKSDDQWQLFAQTIYRRHDTAEEMILKDAPVGAVWNADWMYDNCKISNTPRFGLGSDGRCLYVRTPDGDWCIDWRASNCTLPNDNTHKCWIRHGRPEDGTLHVDKNGHTCAAGAGSIAMPNWHGYLHNGHLVSC